MEAIDLCSGDGWFTLQIARMAHYVVAIDIDGGLLEAARRRLDQSGITNCDFVLGDAYEMTNLLRVRLILSSWQTPSTVFQIGLVWPARCAMR